MAENSNIQWTHHTWNPWRGCEHATLPDGSPHPGCLNCYAEAMSKINPRALGTWGPEGPRVRGAEAYLKQPLAWNKAHYAQGLRERQRVFCSLMDPFEDYCGPIVTPSGLSLWKCFTCDRVEGVGALGPYCAQCRREMHPAQSLGDLRRVDLFPTIDRCAHLDFLLLTKRPQNVRKMWPLISAGRDDLGGAGQTCTAYRPNVWLLASVSDQASAEAMIPPLLACRDLVPVIGLSIEPLVGPVDLRGKLCHWRNTDGTGSWFSPVPGKVRESIIDWVILGGESGPHARPCHVAWIRDLVRQCKAAGVPVFVKQLGAHVVTDRELEADHDTPWPEGTIADGAKYETGWRFRLKDSHGGDPDEWPADLRVREFPRVEVAHA